MGSQGQDAYSANSHSMAGALSGNKWQTYTEASQGQNNFIDSALIAGYTGGALHAAEDQFAKGHGFREWRGFNWFDTATYKHLFNDLFPSSDDLINAYIADMDVFDRIKEKENKCK